MSTGVSPPTIPSIETGTPPKEWSKFVLASSSSESRDTPATAMDPNSNQGTPNIAERLQGESHTAKVPQTVPSHLYSEKKKEEPHISLPSTELRGAQPLEHTGGVGALPGNLSESSVALLPEERQERAEGRLSSSRQRRDTIKPSIGGGEEEPRTSEKEGDETKVPREAVSAEVPGTETAEATTARSFEKYVAPEYGPEASGSQIPDQTKETTSEWASAAAVAAAGGMVGTPPSPGELGEKVGAIKDVEGSNLDSPTLGQKKTPSEGAQGSAEGRKQGRTTSAPSGKEGDYGGEYHPAQLHPPPPGASVAEYRSSLGQQEAQEVQDAPTTTKTGKRESVGGEKKPGFMTVMKGEMKILAGKMSGDEHKVEEGKKLVHGEA